MKQYLDLCRYVLENGQERTDRTGTGTISVFDYRAEYDLADGFPLVTTAEKNFDNIAGEMLWVISGSTNAIELAEKYGFHIWKKWQRDETGDLGRVYGAQWVDFNGVNQLAEIQRILKNDPYSRRMVLSAWNPADLEDMALPPCHWSFELYVDGDKMQYLNLKLHQRSCDVFLGVPYNIAGYALILSLLAKAHGLIPRKLVHDMTNVHIYKDHIEQIKEQLKRQPKTLPLLKIADGKDDIRQYTREDIKLYGYESHSPIKGSVSI